MRILVTNDDGIYSEGIKYLVEFARKLGEVVVVAPKNEQSAKSHGITLRNSVEVKEVNVFEGIKSYSIDSSPADCVRYAYYGLKEKFDMVFSGINKGYNLGYDIFYSGTVAATTEAASLNIKSIAFSTHHDSFKTAIDNIEKVYNFIINEKLFDKWHFYNVNFPLELKNEEILFTQVGECNFDTWFDKDEDMYTQMGNPCFENAKEKLYFDTSAVMNGYISITPLTVDRTNLEVLNKIKGINLK